MLRSISLRTALLVLSLATLLVSGMPSIRAADDPGSDGDLTYNVANAIRFRSSSGLQSDSEYVERSVADHQAFPDLSYGVPLTIEEANDIESRQRLAISTQAALDYAQSQLEYAGMYFDQLDHGHPVFLFSGHQAEHATAIASLLPPSVAARVLAASATLDELVGIYSQIIDDRAELFEIMPMVTVDVDVVTNSVVVGLEREAPDALFELVRRYGGHVGVEILGRVSEDGCNGRNDCGGTTTEPWKGGLKIFLAEHQDAFCTSGILARRGSNLVMITAAHCLVNSPSDYGDNWKHNTNSPRTIGDALDGTMNDADGAPGDGCVCHSDIGWIDVDYHDDVTPLNLFFASDYLDVRPATNVPADSDALQQVGANICRGGAKSNYVCGHIDKLFASRTNLDGHSVDMLRRTDFDASPGDSGAVMFYGTNFLGIHNDSLDGVDPPEPGNSWYSTGARIQAVGNAVCLTSTC